MEGRKITQHAHSKLDCATGVQNILLYILNFLCELSFHRRSLGNLAFKIR